MLRRSSLTWLFCLVALAAVLINYTDARPSEAAAPDPLLESFGGSGDVDPDDELVRESRAAAGFRSTRVGRLGGRRTNPGRRPPHPQNQKRVVKKTVKTEKKEEVKVEQAPVEAAKEQIKAAPEPVTSASVPVPEVPTTPRPPMTDMLSSSTVVDDIARATGMRSPYNSGYGNYGAGAGGWGHDGYGGGGYGAGYGGYGGHSGVGPAPSSTGTGTSSTGTDTSSALTEEVSSDSTSTAEVGTSAKATDSLSMSDFELTEDDDTATTSSDLLE